MKYKVGDKVRVIPVPPQKTMVGPNWTKYMTPFCDKIGVVTDIGTTGWYRFDGFWWLEEWLLPADPQTNEDYETVFRRKRDDNLRSVFLE